MNRLLASSRTRSFGTLAVVVGLCALALGTASKVDAAPTPSTEPATIRAAHLSPDMPGVDIYVTSFTGKTSVYVTDATYGDVGAYQQVPAGTYTFTVRTHGAAMNLPALQTWSLTAKPGYAYTAAEVGTGSNHRGVVLSDNLTPPRPGYGSVRLIQASSRIGSANVVAVGGPVVASRAAFGSSTGYASVRSGTWTLTATGDGRTASARVPVTAGSVTSLLLLDAPGGGVRLASSVDAAGAPSAPKGAVDAGGGGTAAHTHPDSSGVWLAGGVILLLAIILACVGRGRRYGSDVDA